MDFEVYSPEEESFRAEVRSWIEENMPAVLNRPEVDYDKMADLPKLKEFRRKLADKGWAAPTWPVEWGGGGLAPAQASIIDEELHHANSPHWPGMIGRTLIAPAIWIYGTEEQKRRFIPPLIRGDYLPYQLFTEPEAGSDLANLKTRAVKDGDDFVITGHKHFVGNEYDPEWLWVLAVTDPTAKRHHNIGAFFIPATLPGIVVETMDMVITEVKRRVYLDEVRVSREYLIGGETQGWQVSQSTLEMEHGGGGGGRDVLKPIHDMINFAKNTKRKGKPLSSYPHIQRAILDAYVDVQITRLFGVRNGWMHHAQVPMSYQGSQSMVRSKNAAFKIAQAMLEIAGPYATSRDRETAPELGAFERRYRAAVNNSHPAGTVEVHKLIQARRLGMARPPEKAAPVPHF